MAPENGNGAVFSFKPWPVILVMFLVAMGVMGVVYREVADLRTCKVEKTEMNRLEDRLTSEMRNLGVKIDDLEAYIRSNGHGK